MNEQPLPYPPRRNKKKGKSTMPGYIRSILGTMPKGTSLRDMKKIEKERRNTIWFKKNLDTNWNRYIVDKKYRT